MDNNSDVASRSERNQELAWAEITLLGLIFITASIGNLILVMALWRRRKRMSRMYIFMMHLSVADLVVATFQVLPQLIWEITDVFLGPDLLCRGIKYMQLVGMYASTYMTVAMTVDRFQAVCYPMVTFQKKRAFWNAAICSSWCVAFIFSLPQVFIFSKTEIDPGVSECWAKFIMPWGLKAYITWVFTMIFFIPTIVLLICQVQICRIIKINIYSKTHSDFKHNQKQIQSYRASNANCFSKAMIKTVKMTVVTVVVYVLCWAPFFIAQLWSVWFPSDTTQGSVFTIIMLLGNLNSCTNPWIYMYFCGHVPCCRKSHDNSSIREDSAVSMTASINLEEKTPIDNFTSL
ncbi:arg8-vasotocin receptor-like [Acipenser oxyrinchus oxyrinchus]|uniref:Arg8-vasotocin receptor-like n=1 Tax=Acipenser oxyrinchus oxyrinchus TaxID=40147 RepID=A0AAD8DBX3_ACIOX|nr:arg8-vasotocin receptor-like [Acipenser oxyrinchus oxyrinchus]